ncbi:MAG: choice-of-anchor P family protein [Limisphaerales bacterium]
MKNTCLGMRQWIVLLAAWAGWPVLAQENFNLTTTTKYTGRAVALQVAPAPVSPGATPPTPMLVADSGDAPLTGGEVHTFYKDAAAIPGVTAQALDAVTIGAGGKNRSQSSLAHLDGRLGTHHITALWVESEAAAAVKSRNVPATGKSTVEGLTLDGNPVAATGEANQTVTFRDGYLVINEQSGTATPHFGTYTVNALHFFVVGSGDIIAASSKAEVIYSPLPEAPP